MPKSVFADLRCVRKGSQVDDDFELLLFYEGLRVRLHSSTMISAVEAAYVLHGTNGSFLKHRTDRQEDLLRAGSLPDFDTWFTESEPDYGTLYTIVNGATEQKKIKSRQGSYLHFYNALYDALTEGDDVPVPASEAILVMRVIEAARKSSTTMERVAIKSVREYAA